MEVLEKIKFLVILVLSGFILSSCGAKKNKAIAPNIQVANYAKAYIGTPYQFGGKTPKGMDCSGLINVSYNKIGYNLPRTTKQLSKSGKKVRKKKAQVGDLIFFRTLKRSRKKSHVGIITLAEGREIEFIHSSSSRGVMISTLSNPYWKRNFAEVRRYIK